MGEVWCRRHGRIGPTQNTAERRDCLGVSGYFSNSPGLTSVAHDADLEAKMSDFVFGNCTRFLILGRVRCGADCMGGLANTKHSRAKRFVWESSDFVGNFPVLKTVARDAHLEGTISGFSFLESIHIS